MTNREEPTAGGTGFVAGVIDDITNNVLRLLIAGGLGIVAWEVTTDTVTRLLFAQSPQPHGLVQGLLGIQARWLAEAIHYVAGIVAFPLGYVVFRRLSPLPWLVNGAIYGVALWFLALGVFATIAGFGFMLGWGNVTWASGVGHVVLAIAIAWSWECGVEPTQ